MDERVLVEVYVPAVMKRYDVGLSLRLTIAQVMELLHELLVQQLGHAQWIKAADLLYNSDTHEILSHNLCVQSAGIQMGDRLILF